MKHSVSQVVSQDPLFQQQLDPISRTAPRRILSLALVAINIVSAGERSKIPAGWFIKAENFDPPAAADILTVEEDRKLLPAVARVDEQGHLRSHPLENANVAS